MPGPLAGIKVIDFSAVISGPLSSMILADQGADVIKVESPGRPDLLRKEWYFRGGLTSMFANCNRGKRSVAIDLQSEAGLEALGPLRCALAASLAGCEPLRAQLGGAGGSIACDQLASVAATDRTSLFGSMSPRWPRYCAARSSYTRPPTWRCAHPQT